MWSMAADRAFRELKHRFTTAPILVHLDPSRQFVVEANASDVGVGAVLSQRSTLDLKLHPFFSPTSPPQRGITMLGIGSFSRLRWHCRNGGTGSKGPNIRSLCGPTTKNLEYLHTAKRLNSRQARRALLFTRFNLPSLTGRGPRK